MLQILVNATSDTVPTFVCRLGGGSDILPCSGVRSWYVGIVELQYICTVDGASRDSWLLAGSNGPIQIKHDYTYSLHVENGRLCCGRGGGGGAMTRGAGV